jgi:hypothetical protein
MLIHSYSSTGGEPTYLAQAPCLTPMIDSAAGEATTAEYHDTETIKTNRTKAAFRILTISSMQNKDLRNN